MLFDRLVRVSAAVRGTQSRLRKLEELASFIEQLFAGGSGVASPGKHLELGVALLSGELPDGRIGLGPAQVFKHPPASAQAEPSLTIADVAEAFAAIGGISVLPPRPSALFNVACRSSTST